MKFEFDGTEKADQNIEMSKYILEKLIEHKCLRIPSIYIRPEIDSRLRHEINEALKNLQCEIAADEYDATHIVFPEVNYQSENYARPHFKRGDKVWIHWYYLPESYDSWVENTFDFVSSS